MPNTKPSLDLQRLREAAENTLAVSPARWESIAYPTFSGCRNPVVVTQAPGHQRFVATCYDRQEVEHIAIFDPRTVLELLDRIAELEAVIASVKDVANVACLPGQHENAVDKIWDLVKAVAADG